MTVIAALEIVFGLVLAGAVAIIVQAVTDPHPVGAFIVWSVPLVFIAFPVLAIWLFSLEQAFANRLGLAALSVTPTMVLLYQFKIYG